jgi:hypothetical protein
VGDENERLHLAAGVTRGGEDALTFLLGERVAENEEIDVL